MAVAGANSLGLITTQFPDAKEIGLKFFIIYGEKKIISSKKCTLILIQNNNMKTLPIAPANGIKVS